MLRQVERVPVELLISPRETAWRQMQGLAGSPVGLQALAVLGIITLALLRMGSVRS